MEPIGVDVAVGLMIVVVDPDTGTISRGCAGCGVAFTPRGGNVPGVGLAAIVGRHDVYLWSGFDGHPTRFVADFTHTRDGSVRKCTAMKLTCGAKRVRPTFSPQKPPVPPSNF